MMPAKVFARRIFLLPVEGSMNSKPCLPAVDLVVIVVHSPSRRIIPAYETHPLSKAKTEGIDSAHISRGKMHARPWTVCGVR